MASVVLVMVAMVKVMRKVAVKQFFLITIMPLNNVQDYHHGHDGDRVGGGGGILPCSPNAFNEDADDIVVFLATLLVLLVPKGP